MNISNFLSYAAPITLFLAAVVFLIRQRNEAKITGIRVKKIENEIERIEAKLDSHMGDSSRQNEELKKLIEEAKLSAKTHSNNNAEDIKRFIKELSIKEIKETLTNES